MRETSQGVQNLFERQDRMASYGPTFCDITWGAGGSTQDLTLDIAKKMQNMVSCCRTSCCLVPFKLALLTIKYLQICVETMMHLTCTNMPQSDLEAAMQRVRFDWRLLIGLHETCFDCKSLIWWLSQQVSKSDANSLPFFAAQRRRYPEHSGPQRRPSQGTRRV